ncbi:MAG: cyclodeaminase/cyclohydrolase family protein [Planctomycetes bacterium]|nr:cyclodeaminase/cyclohydrolase family protein [Planctomycetota bacterium]
MISQSFQELVESLAAKTPTPGGGAAAAMAGCMGTSLFLMTVRFSQGKKANADREDDLARVETLLQDHLQRLLPMAERDCKAFDLVSAAYGMPKDSDDQKALRDKAIQEAMVGAMVVPEETQAMIRDVFVAMEKVSDCIGKAIVSDLASGAALLLAAAEGAYLNVRINAAYLSNRELADSTMTRATAVRDEIRRQQDAIAVSVDRKLG